MHHKFIIRLVNIYNSSTILDISFHQVLINADISEFLPKYTRPHQQIMTTIKQHMSNKPVAQTIVVSQPGPSTSYCHLSIVVTFIFVVHKVVYSLDRSARIKELVSINILRHENRLHPSIVHNGIVQGVIVLWVHLTLTR
jgi:hypothetical protein